jgi:bifunctional enzyme Fae/Hps
MAGDATADVIGFSGLAPLKTQERFIEECHKVGAMAYMDTTNMPDPLEVIKKLSKKPDIVELQGRINKEKVQEIKKACNALVAVANELNVKEVKEFLNMGADILVISEAITRAKDVNGTISAFLKEMGIYEVDQFRIMTDF